MLIDPLSQCCDVHTYTHIYTYICVYTHIYIHVHTYIHTYIHVHVHTYIFVYRYARKTTIRVSVALNCLYGLYFYVSLDSFLIMPLNLFIYIYVKPNRKLILFWLMYFYYNVLFLSLLI